jgi:hypothetical protein
MVAIRVHALVVIDQAPPQRLNEVPISGHLLHSEPQSLGTLTSFFFFANANTGVNHFRSRERSFSRERELTGSHGHRGKES